MITQGIIKYSIIFMRSTITRESAKKRAKRFTKPHYQSKTAIAKDTIQYNIYTDKQIIPARPRDFRMNLADDEKNIGMSELTDILSNPLIKNFVERIHKKYPFKRGRPDSSLAEERRGFPTHYVKSEVSKILEIILNDSKLVETIDNNVTNHEIFPQYLNYSQEVKYKEKNENEIAFRNSYKPLKEKLKSEELVEKADQTNTPSLNRIELNILYRAGALLFFNSLLLSQLD